MALDGTQKKMSGEAIPEFQGENRKLDLPG